MKTALVHDWIITAGGAEKVLESLIGIFQAPVYTLLYDAKHMQESFFAKQIIHTSFLQNIPFSLSFYRYLLPLFPKAIQTLDVSSYDVILSNSHAVAKSVLKKEGQLHICYCHTPMRYAWDLQDTYLNSFGFLLKMVARAFFQKLQKWDRNTSSQVDIFIANSAYIAKRIASAYGRQSHVIYPPVSVEDFYSSSQKENYYVTHGRLVPYKKTELLVKAFAKMPNKKLIVIGTGPEKAAIKCIATKNVELLGYVPPLKLAEILSKAKAYLFAAEEDFGIGVVEAQASGLPVIAFNKGGALETVVDGKTGLFFQKQSEASLIEAIHLFEKNQDSFDPVLIQKHAAFFNPLRFQTEFQQFVEKSKKEFLNL